MQITEILGARLDLAYVKMSRLLHFIDNAGLEMSAESFKALADEAIESLNNVKELL